jgi:hypothetical protein
MNKPKPIDVTAPGIWTNDGSSQLLTIEQVETLARLLIPVPIGALIITQQLQTSFDLNRANIVRWSISHFAPNNCNQCTGSDGSTPLEALSVLVKKLTDPASCVILTPSA